MRREIRQAEGADLDAIRTVVNKAYEVYVPLMDRTPAPMLDDYMTLIAENKVTVVLDSGRIVGVLVAWIEDEAVYVDNIAIDPASQGAGIGCELLDVAAEFAKTAGLGRVWLYTNALMQNNIGYYERRGFVVTGRRLDKGYDRIYFERML